MEKTKFAVLTLASFVLLAALASFASANDIMTAEVDIIVPEKVVSIEVQEHVSLGNITLGYGTQRTDQVKTEINNTGTVDVTVTPELVEADDVFEYLHFTERASGARLDWRQIGNWSMNISQPSSFGGVREEYFYTRVDLTEFTGEISQSLLDHEGDVLFVAVEK